jgi:hypothetical protein
MMKENLNIYKIIFEGYRGEPDSVYLCAHSAEYAIQCFKDCSDDKILSITECLLADGFILD